MGENVCLEGLRQPLPPHLIQRRDGPGVNALVTELQLLDLGYHLLEGE